MLWAKKFWAKEWAAPGLLVGFVAAINIQKFFLDELAAARQTRILVMFATLVILSGIYSSLVAAAVQQSGKRAVAMRPRWLALLLFFCCIFTPSLLETDHFRYIIDGLAAAKGINPYRFSPAELQQLYGFDFFWVKEINHPEYHTIYPPLAQVLFVLSSYLNPFFWPHIFGTGFGFSLADAAFFRHFAAEFGLKVLTGSTCVLVVLLLRQRRFELVVLHPLFLFHVVSNAHVDALMLPGLLLVSRSVSWVRGTEFGAKSANKDSCRFYFQIFGWLCALLIKWLPVVFFPIVFLRWWAKIGLKGTLLALLLSGALVTGVCFLYARGSDGAFFTSLLAYGNNWYFFGYGHWLFVSILDLLQVSDHPIQLAKLLALACFSFGTVFLVWLYLKAFLSAQLSLALCALVFFVFFPTLHPWYLLTLLALGAPYLRVLPVFWFWPMLALASHVCYLEGWSSNRVQFVVYAAVSLVLWRDLRRVTKRVHFNELFRISGHRFTKQAL